MANKKLSELSAIDFLMPEDLFAVVDDPAVTPITKKATMQQIANCVNGDRIVTVNLAGKGDFTSIKAACDYVASKNPVSSSTGWGIKVTDIGAHAENPFTVPNYSILYSEMPWHGFAYYSIPQVVILPANYTGGPFITMGNNSVLFGFYIISSVADNIVVTSPTLVYGSGNKNVFISNCTLGLRAHDSLETVIASVDLDNCGMSFSHCNFSPLMAQNDNLVMCKTISGSCGINLNYCKFTDISTGGGTVIQHNSSGNVHIAFCRFGVSTPNFTYDIQNTGDGEVRVWSSPVRSVDGAILFVDAMANIHTSNNAAATTLGSVIGKLPVYDKDNVLIGYLPIYDGIT